MANKKENSDKKWSSEVTEHSDALDLEEGVFTLDDPKKIAESLKHSAEKSHRKKRNPLSICYVNAYILHKP